MGVWTNANKLIQMGREDPTDFMVRALDVEEKHVWSKMTEISRSMRDNERTAVAAGHGVSKTYTLARLALAYLYCHPPSTVVTTAPTGAQVKDLLWREIRTAHSNSKIPLGGKLTTLQLDLQGQTGMRWFATGFSTRPDTVTKEATAFQGYHNEHLLIVFDEAAGILPEIWRAAEHIGAPHKRMVAIGNPTSAAGEFAQSLSDPTWNYINIAVTDTPNYQAGKTIIPGVYGKEYERRIAQKYGEDSDEYRVRVLGQVSRRAVLGSYYGEKINELRRMQRVCELHHNPNHQVHIVCDIGYTSAFWFVQMVGTNCHMIRYYEDSGVGLEQYARIFRDIADENGYAYGKMIVPCDMDSNSTRVVTGMSALETMRDLGYHCVPLPVERRVQEGIQRTRKFLDVCLFSDGEECAAGLHKLSAYHEAINKHLSTEENPVYTGTPEKDGNDHAADAFRYVSMAAQSGYLRASGSGMTPEQARRLQQKYMRPVFA